MSNFPKSLLYLKERGGTLTLWSFKLNANTSRLTRGCSAGIIFTLFGVVAKHRLLSTKHRGLRLLTLFIVDFRKDPGLVVEIRELFFGQDVGSNHLREDTVHKCKKREGKEKFSGVIKAA